MRPTIQRPTSTGATIRIRPCLAVILVGTLAMPSGPAAAQERLLRCITLASPAQLGQRPQHVAQRHVYAPAHNAMFFSRAEDACRWRRAQHRRS